MRITVSLCCNHSVQPQKPSHFEQVGRTVRRRIRAAALARASPSPLTCVDLLEGDVLLQLTPQFDLSAVLSRGAVVRQDEVGVEAVEHRQLAHGVGHGLVGAHHLTERAQGFGTGV